MTQAKTLLLSELLSSGNGIIKTDILNKNRFTSRDIAKLLDKGVIKRIKQGHYIGNKRDISDMELAAKLIPKGVLCLFSAVEYYELSTVNPSEICMALPRGTTCPSIPSNLFVKVYHMTDSHFEAGITEVDVNGVMLRMYDIEKTVCDCFKYDNEVEKGIALEVIKSYITKRNCNIQKLLNYARLLGKKKVIYPYVEALI